MRIPLGLELLPLFGRESKFMITIGRRLEHAPAHVLRLAKAPAEPVAQIERPALEDHVVAAGVGRRREQRDKVRRTQRRGEELHGGAVAAAEHPYTSVHVRQRRHPLDCVVAVGPFVVRHGHAVGHIASARVLHDDDKAGLGKAMVLARGRVGVLRVGRALQQRRTVPVGPWAVDVRTQHHPVAHPRREIFLDDDVCGRLGPRTALNQPKERAGQNRTGQ